MRFITVLSTVALTVEAIPNPTGPTQTHFHPRPTVTGQNVDESHAELKKRIIPAIGIGLWGIITGLGAAGVSIGTGLAFFGKRKGKPSFPQEPKTPQQPFVPPPIQIITGPPVKGGPTPTPTSTTSSSSSTCDMEDPRTAPVVVETKTAEYPVWDRAKDAVLRGDKLDGLRKLVPTDAPIQKRAAREVTICGVGLKSPAYTPYSSKSPKRWPFYDYKLWNMCSVYRFEADNWEKSSPNYATEHVYEVSLIIAFLRWRRLQQDFVGLLNGAGSCLIYNLLLDPTEKWTTTAHYGDPKVKFGANKWRRPMDTLYAQLSGDQRPGELVYLLDILNTRKNQMLSQDAISCKTSKVKDCLSVAAQVQMVLRYLEDPTVSDIFYNVHQRMVAFYQGLDRAFADATNDSVKYLRLVMTSNWEDSYRTWLKELLKGVATNVDLRIKQMLDAAEELLKQDPNKPTDGQKKALLTSIRIRRYDDTFEPAKYSLQHLVKTDIDLSS